MKTKNISYYKSQHYIRLLCPQLHLSVASSHLHTSTISYCHFTPLFAMSHSLHLLPASLPLLSRFSADISSMPQCVLPLCYFFPSQSLYQVYFLYPIPTSTLINPLFLKVQFRVSPSLKNPLIPSGRGNHSLFMTLWQHLLLPHVWAFEGYVWT